MKKTVLFSVLALTTSVFADGEMIAASQQRGQSQQMGYNHSGNENQNQKNIVTLSSARPESENGWYLFADALYWHADVGDIDWAVKNGNTSETSVTNSVHHLDFKWSWGFKVGLGINMDHDGWDSNINYTWFETENSNRAGVDPATGVVTDNLGGFGNFTTGKIKGNIYFSMLDWELGRWYYLSKNLTMRPHVGIKGGCIDQKIHLELTNENAATTQTNYHAAERFKTDFWGVGPSAGVNTMWVLGHAGETMDHRFSLFGDFGGALMYGHFDVKNHQTYLLEQGGSVAHKVSFSDLDRNLMTAMLQGMLGLSWDTSFNEGHNHFMMKLGYELQHWFRQNQLFCQYNSGNSQLGRRLSEAALSLQGLTAEFRFDF